MYTLIPRLLPSREKGLTLGWNLYVDVGATGRSPVRIGLLGRQGMRIIINTGAETCATTDLYLWRIHFQHPKRTPSSTLLPSREKESFMLSICNTNRGRGGLRFAPPTLQILIAECHFLPVSCEKHGRIRRV